MPADTVCYSTGKLLTGKYYGHACLMMETLHTSIDDMVRGEALHGTGMEGMGIVSGQEEE